MYDYWVEYTPNCQHNQLSCMHPLDDGHNLSTHPVVVLSVIIRSCHSPNWLDPQKLKLENMTLHVMYNDIILLDCTIFRVYIPEATCFFKSETPPNLFLNMIATPFPIPQSSLIQWARLTSSSVWKRSPLISLNFILTKTTYTAHMLSQTTAKSMHRIKLWYKNKPINLVQNFTCSRYKTTNLKIQYTEHKKNIKTLLQNFVENNVQK